MGSVIVGWVMLLLAAGALVISVRSFGEKGFVFNNAYIYASKEERESMDKRPYYRQSAIAFLMVAAALAVIGLAALMDMAWLSFVGTAAGVALVVYAIASDVAIERKKKS